MTLQSKVTSKGRTTVPVQVRRALEMRAGDRIEFVLAGDHAVLRKSQGTADLAGTLPSPRGRGLSWRRIREGSGRAATR